AAYQKRRTCLYGLTNSTTTSGTSTSRPPRCPLPRHGQRTARRRERSTAEAAESEAADIAHRIKAGPSPMNLAALHELHAEHIDRSTTSSPAGMAAARNLQGEALCARFQGG